MLKITKVVHVNSDPKKAMEYIGMVENHPAFIPALKSVDNLDGDCRVPGTTWNWTYVMGGIQLVGSAETKNYEENKCLVYETRGGIISTFEYAAEAEEGGALLSVNIDYEIPETTGGKMLDNAVMQKLNEQEAETAMENLKVILES